MPRLAPVDGTGVAARLARLPVGTSYVRYRGRRWVAVRSVAAGGRVERLWAEELGGRAFVSANLYLTGDGERLRPCEMPEAVVLDFLDSWEPWPDPVPPAPRREEVTSRTPAARARGRRGSPRSTR